MAFTVNDFQDMLVLLDQHPEWRRQLLVVLLPEEFLKLPESVEALTQTVAALAERQERTEAAIAALTQTVAALAKRQERTEAAILSLTERVDQLTVRVDQLTAHVDQLTVRLDQLIVRVDQLTVRLDQLAARLDAYIEHSEASFADLRKSTGTLKGSLLEVQYRTGAASYFGTLVSKGRPASNMIGDLLYKAAKSGQITKWERIQVMAADILWSGEVYETGQPVVLVAEVSWTVLPEDVDRAFDRATILQRLGLLAVPLAAGEEWSDDVKSLAESKRVAMRTDGMIDDESWQAALAEAERRVAA